MKKLKALFLGSLIFTVLGLLSAAVLLDQPLPSDKRSVKKMLQQYIHGSISNRTNHTIRITEYRFIHPLPAGFQSEGINIYDVDSLLIDRPTEIEGKLYTSGVFRFCDFVTLTVKSLPDRDQVTPNQGVTICRLISDYQYYGSIEDAFY